MGPSKFGKRHAPSPSETDKNERSIVGKQAPRPPASVELFPLFRVCLPQSLERQARWCRAGKITKTNHTLALSDRSQSVQKNARITLLTCRSGIKSYLHCSCRGKVRDHENIRFFFSNDATTLAGTYSGRLFLWVQKPLEARLRAYLSKKSRE